MLVGMMFQEHSGDVWEIKCIVLGGDYLCENYLSHLQITVSESILEYQTNQKQISWINEKKVKTQGNIEITYSPFILKGLQQSNSLGDITFNTMKNAMTLQQLKQQCNHKWKLYQGFTDVYQYCEHCDEKKK